MSTPLEVLYEDADLIAINKPAGLPSQSTVDPKRAHVISLLKVQFPSANFYLHHRLDKDTSGVLLLGKTKRVNAGLTDIFREHQIQKTYWALCKSKSENPPQNEFTIEDHLAPVRGNNKQLMRMVKVKKGGWHAKTHFCTLINFKDFSLIEAKPITGRTHQIRVHLAGLRFPIAGDSLYGGQTVEVPRLMLHAKILTLKHPITGKDLTLEAPLPTDFSSILKRLGATSF